MQTSGLMNAAMKTEKLSIPRGDKVMLPEKVWYIIFSKTKEDVLRDVKIRFNEDLAEAFENVVQFKEFMKDYYASTLAPLWGAGEELPKTEEEEADKIEIIRSMIEFLERKGKNSLILIDSLDDLIRAFPSGEENRLLGALRSIQTHNKNNWNSLILNRLTEGVFEGSVEESIFSMADGVFDFKSTTSGGKKRRVLNCRKFTGAAADLLDSSFEYQITDSGFEARRVSLLEG